MRSIITTYLQPTNRRCARVHATNGRDECSIPCPEEWSLPRAHYEAARTLAHRLRWPGRVATEERAKGHRFVHVLLCEPVGCVE